ncbi:MAG TPA: cupin domain-containing protein [Chloroflexota bacterium]|nr:cupin domain-containing protein [Chloroflexota bacterium]
MARAGDVLEHPITGERIVVRRSALDTQGRLFELDIHVRPKGFVAAEHIHPLQEERFEILSGTLRGTAAGQPLAGGPGDRLVVPAGTPHLWWNAGEDELHVRGEVRPALRIERFFESFFGLAQDGKVSPKTGLPNPLQMAVIMRAYRNELILARPPRPVQTLVFAALAAIGKLLGYSADYPYPRAPSAPGQVGLARSRAG